MKKGVLLAFLVFAVAFGPTAGAGVYKVTGPDGKVTYTDSHAKGADAKVETVEIDAYSGSAESSAASRKVTIFTTEWCGVCRKAKSYMASHGIAYDEFDIEKSPSAKNRFDRLGGRVVPVILIGTEKMMGFSPVRFEAMLRGSGM